VLLASFQHAHALRVCTALAGDLSHALQPADGLTAAGEDIKPGPEPEVLLLFPELCMVMLLHGDNDDDNEEDYKDVEHWWGIWQPDEIWRLVDWIAIKNSMYRRDSEASHSQEQWLQQAYHICPGWAGSVSCEHRHHWLTEGWQSQVTLGHMVEHQAT
jgi:hypothetical protein